MSLSVKILRKESYPLLVQNLAATVEVYAPVTKNYVVLYRRVQSAAEIEDDYILPRLSAKSLVFSRTEQLFSYRKSKDDVQIRQAAVESFPERVILGVRPCDASGLDILHGMFATDPKDEIFEARFDKTTVIGLSCNESDAYCFCSDGTSGSTVGSDILLTRTEAGDYLVEMITAKGAKIVDRYPDLFEALPIRLDKDQYLAKVPHIIDKESLSKRLPGMFDSDIFDDQALLCVGCGTCAYVCPVCACFDIQDESRGNCGRRVRCWDSCAFSMFTKHTSGHNPRETQGQRWRQRLMHKFSYMTEGDRPSGCVGCGRCSRSCPAGINLVESLNAIDN